MFTWILFSEAAGQAMASQAPDQPGGSPHPCFPHPWLPGDWEDNGASALFPPFSPSNTVPALSYSTGTSKGPISDQQEPSVSL